LLILGIILSGCSLEKQIEVKTEEVKRLPLNIDNQAPLTLEPIQWFVITEDNIEEVFKELKSREKNIVLFSLSDTDYEAMSLNFSRIRNYIIINNEILKKYKNYYENGDRGNGK